MALPILLSVPHAGLTVPRSLQSNCLLTVDQIVQDGDEYALEIYTRLEQEAAAYVQADIARAVVDMNRASDDIRMDGVVKTHTCWGVPIWRTPLAEEEVYELLRLYHKPYHQRLSELSSHPDLLLAVDCHTMAACGPPVGPDSGMERPQVCLGNVNGSSCPNPWMPVLKHAFEQQFPGEVTLNRPFSGGYITQFHSAEMPWIQLELSRGDYASPEQKSEWVYNALSSAISTIINKKAGP